MCVCVPLCVCVCVHLCSQEFLVGRAVDCSNLQGKRCRTVVATGRGAICPVRATQWYDQVYVCVFSFVRSAGRFKDSVVVSDSGLRNHPHDASCQENSIGVPSRRLEADGLADSRAELPALISGYGSLLQAECTLHTLSAN